MAFVAESCLPTLDCEIQLPLLFKSVEAQLAECWIAGCDF